MFEKNCIINILFEKGMLKCSNVFFFVMIFTFR